MIIYDKEGLRNVKIVSVASQYYQKGLITKDELSAIEHTHPSPFYTPNLFVRIGFFILTCIISAFGCGLLCLLMAESDIVATYGWVIFLAILNYVALEVLTNQNHYYKAGVDDALLWISGGLLVGAVIALGRQWRKSSIYFSFYFSGSSCFYHAIYRYACRSGILSCCVCTGVF